MVVGYVCQNHLWPYRLPPWYCRSTPLHKRTHSAGVMIIFGPDLTHTWERSGKLAPVQSNPSSIFLRRMIGVTLSFPNASNRPTNMYHHRATGSIKLFLCSVYHLYDHKEQAEFYDKIASFFSNSPRKSELLVGADANCNLGVQMPVFKDILRPFGIKDRNNNSKDLVYTL